MGDRKPEPEWERQETIRHRREQITIRLCVLGVAVLLAVLIGIGMWWGNQPDPDHRCQGVAHVAAGETVTLICPARP